ncbi:hypothetical protein EVG20_g1227 [Dentipellis fragilis]|uniref:Nucleic acid-binding protein n=1 Tax=Dentipellis fragilis TaxID=205917 RepID=A0A4Y9ZEC8_9AGAM|nr:hypothetical protein EVG20_g1227 [Dentipellis fragilis]
MSLSGLVTKVGFMNKTATVTVSRWVVHKQTGKRLIRSKKFLVHDEMNQLRMEDSVLIQNCPPISARKRFTLRKVTSSPEAEREEAHARLAAEAAAAASGSSQPENVAHA